MFADPPQPWQRIRPEDEIQVADLPQALQGFLAERQASLAWLRELESPDWDRTTQAPWGTISAGDLLVSWVEHDYLHLRQLIEVLHAWNVHQAAPYSVRYAGEW